MEKIFIVHYGEVGLKGKNRSFFEKKLVQNIRLSLKDIGYTEVRRIYGRILVTLQAEADVVAIRERLGKVMGIAHFELACAAALDIEAIQAAALAWIEDKRFNTLKVETKRANKRFPLTSPEVSAAVGGYLLKHTGAKADMHNPDLRCNIEIVENSAYIYTDKIRGVGGLPVGVSGNVLVMLSGGLDSPVAAWRMMKRGVKAIFIHFYSYPYTDKASLEKVEELAQILATWNYQTRIYLVPFGEVQREIVTKTPAPFRVILYRRMMVRIAQRIAAAAKANALVTGESLGQVASQTLGNIRVIEAVAELPILRPLIGDDKVEIIARAEQIGTYETSILPHDDCCSLFVPKHPATNASLAAVREAEADLEIDTLIAQAVEAVETRTIDPS
ncbi:MAG: tRNA 4-thiouridine(8) synthase ThiI [Candidatus Poribacteria bacterium]|nr:tRNA 4-thiouridine(8) synthase ThiI [Candidatus Poribacteria bacterium]